MSNPVFNRMEGQWANQSTAATAQATHPLFTIRKHLRKRGVRMKRPRLMQLIWDG